MARELTPALRAVMGDWVYYISTLQFSDVAHRINYAHEIHKNDALNDLIQRQLDGSRAGKIADYLCREEQRFFNALVVGVYGGDPSWYDFDEIAPTNDSPEVPNDAADRMGFLSLTGDETLFALDGQHRLAGIKQALKKSPDLGDEQIAVIFVAHRSGDDGLQRTRRLFTVLNKTAKPVLKGDIIALDEDDVMAICTRRLLNDCRYFNRGQVAMRLLSSLPPSDTSSWTTVTMMYDMLTILFLNVYPQIYETTLNKKDKLKNERPREDVLDEYYAFAVEYFELLADTFPEVKEVFDGETPSETVETHRHREGGSVLFRPVGQKVFCQLISLLCKSYTLEDAFGWVSLLPTDLSGVPYADVIWDTGNRRMSSSNTDANHVKELLLYMLGEETRHTEETLRTRYAQYLGRPEEEVSLPEKLVEASVIENRNHN